MTGETETHAATRAARPEARIRLGVVIINFRTAALTINCLKSLSDQLVDVGGQVVVVDNASGDGSDDAIEAWLANSPLAPSASLIRSDVNSGFSGGNNIGLSAIDADYYLLLNSDTQLRADAVAHLLAAADQRPSAGVIAPRLENPDGSPQQSCFRFISPTSELIESASTAPLTRLFAQSEVALPVSDSARECDWVSFAAVLIRREALAAAGPMDDGFFMYFEDTEFCKRIADAGFDIVYDPRARVVHHRGGSSPVKSAIARGGRPPAYYYASRTRYFRKLYGPLGPTAANAMWLLGRAIARMRVLVGKPVRPACERQSSDIWMNWRNPLGDSRGPERAS